MQHIVTPQPTFYREQCQDRERDASNPRIADCQPRQDAKDDVGDQSSGQAIHSYRSLAQTARDFASGLPSSPSASSGSDSRPLNSSTWCTGKDSNLRTSLGGTDLQSVGFNHSPTCANFRAMRPPHPDHAKNPPRNLGALTVNPQTTHNIFSQNRETKGSRKPRRELPLHAGKVPNGVRLEKPVAPLPSPPPAGKSCSFSGAGEGNRTPDPLITNQMLYRLSYASNTGDRRAIAQAYPSDPCQMSGTIS